MKKSLAKTLTLLGVLALLSACNKDHVADTVSNETVSLPKDPIERLRTFRKKIEHARIHPEAKSCETRSLSDALWDVENLFNLTYSDVEDYYDQVNSHEFTLSLPIDGQQRVLENDVAAFYEEVIAQARAAITSDEFDNKGFLSLTVKDVNIDSQESAITFSGKTGNRTSHNTVVAHVDGPFGIDDNWMFAAPLGKCDDPDIPSGADEQLQEHLYAELIEPFTETENGYRNIYLNRQTFIFDGSNYSGIYYNTNPDDLCIGHLYLNDYFFNEKRVISQTIPGQYHLEGYSPVSIEISGILTEDGTAATHYNEVEYGIRTQVRIDEFGTVESLIP